MEQTKNRILKCPSCNKVVSEKNEFCSVCNTYIANGKQKEREKDDFENNPEPYHALKNSFLLKAKNTPRCIIGLILFSIIAIVVIFTFHRAASGIQTYGNDMALISSVGGQTMEEVYYRNLGLIFIMLAKCLRAFSWFLGTVIIWLGLNISDNKFSFFKK